MSPWHSQTGRSWLRIWPPAQVAVAHPALRRSRVFFYTADTAMQSPGGGEIQLLETARHLQMLGVDVKLFDPWRHRLDQADCIHLFGTLPECLKMAQLAKQCGAAVVLSPISWYDPWAQWNSEPSVRRRFRGVVGWSTRSLLKRIPGWRSELVALADLLLPNSQAEARQLSSLFGVAPERIAVVPNGADRSYEQADPALFQQRFGLRDFVLVPGRIEPRKNQLAVIRALWGLGVPVVLLGDPHPKHFEYAQHCRSESDPGVVFLPRIPHDNPLLASAYAAARVVVLASWFETPGLAALEAALAGSNIVVTRIGSAHEYFAEQAWYVAPNNLLQIRATVREAYTSPGNTDLRTIVRSRYLWNHVAEATLRAYARVLTLESSRAQESLAA